MNSDFVELPKHIKETLEFYNTKYETLVYQQDAFGGSAKSVPSDGHTTCRYCEKSDAQVKFKTDCHALLDSIGNRHLFAEDECDSCNQFFGTGIEDHFGKWSLPNRVISCVRGKKGYPSIKREHLGWRIDSSATGIHVSMNEEHSIAKMDVENKSITLDLPRDAFIPIAVFKTFVRMGLAMMPRAELTANFRPVVDWLMEKDHTKQPDNVCPRMLYSYIPHNAPPDTVAVVLAGLSRL